MGYKKIFAFISAVKEAKGTKEVLEGAETTKYLSKLGKVGEVAKGGLKTAGCGIAGLGALGGTALGKKLGGEIQPGLKIWACY